MTSQVDICNVALGYLGQAPITSLSDNNARAQVCSQNYQPVFESLLEEKQWSFATKFARLLPDENAQPVHSYDYAFRLPNLTKHVFEVRNQRNLTYLNWEVVGDYIYATEPSIDIKYLYLEDNPNNYSTVFVEIMEYKLAHRMAIALTEDFNLFNVMRSMYEERLQRAASLDGLQASRERLRTRRLVDVRGSGNLIDNPIWQQGSGSYQTTVPDSPTVILPQGTISGPTSVQMGNDATYTSTVSGTQPITYQWQKDGFNIAGATSDSYTITESEYSDAGTYRCVFTNSAGSSFSNSIELNIGCESPILVISGPETVDQGESFTYSSSIVAGNLPITYQWQKDNVDISGATSANYTVNSASASDDGVYRCLGSNICESDVPSTNTITLTVDTVQPPTISISPTSASPIAPDTVTFTVTVDDDGGDAAIVYQWLVDGDEVGANTPNYTTDATVSGESFTVSVIATNSGGASNEPQASVNPVSNLISETAFSSDDTLVLSSECNWIEVQGCGGGGGGGAGALFNQGTMTGGSGGGGGGAALVSVLNSSATPSGTLTLTIGQGGAGSSTEGSDASDGTNSTVSGAGTVGLLWEAGEGGSSPATNQLSGGDGGNNSSNLGGGAGGASLRDDGDDGTDGGGGGGGAHDDLGGSDDGGNGGNGGGPNGGTGGVRTVDNINGCGGGGGGNGASWWDGSPAGSGGNGGTKFDVLPTNATGFGNGGGGSSSGSGVPLTSGSDGSNGYLIVRQYRNEP